MPCTFSGFSSRADGSAGLRFTSQELTSDQFAELKDSLNSYGWLLFETQEQNLAVPTENITDDTRKPSMRMRAVLYLMWKQQGEKGDFEAFYRGQMELIIGKIKSKLND